MATLNNIHERALRIVYRDYESTFQQLLKQNNSVSINQSNVLILATEIFKKKNSLNPVIVEDVFNFKNLAYTLESRIIGEVGIIGGLYIVIIINNRGGCTGLKK